jgi:rRNA-processing protein FCF1
MKVSRSRLIVDTNVLIDLHSGGIVEQFFALPYEFVSPDVIIEESEEPDGKELERQGLIRAELSSDGALPLLTGDRRLRNLADKHRVPVHGTLWVLDEMVKHNVLTKGQAAHALQLMLDKNSRLPPSECTHRFRLWEGK